VATRNRSWREGRGKAKLQKESRLEKSCNLYGPMMPNSCDKAFNVIGQTRDVLASYPLNLACDVALGMNHAGTSTKQ
jgi:hypothetical protein